MQGRVTVNGRVINSPALDVTANDVVTVDGKPLPPRERTRLFLYHKPRGLMTTHADPEGRPTVFDNLPEGLPRLISIGRLDFNTEGLLLLTNDGGLARALELPDTGWLRRYRVRAHGEVTQGQLDELKKGVEVDGVKYGPIDATLERDQGANVWLVFAIREGKNREVRNVLAHLGLEVNRLIRVSYGPFQLGELAEGEVEEVKTRVLREQLGEKIATLAGADFNRPMQASKIRGSRGRCAARQEAVQAGRQERPDRRPQGPPRAGAAHRQRGGARPQRGRGQRLRPAAASAARLSRQARSEAAGRVELLCDDFQFVSSWPSLSAQSTSCFCSNSRRLGCPARDLCDGTRFPALPPQGLWRRVDLACYARRRWAIEGPQSGLAVVARHPADRGSPARVAVQHPDPCL